MKYFENVKIGSKVISLEFGIGKVEYFNKKENLIEVRFDKHPDEWLFEYTFSGQSKIPFYQEDIKQSLFYIN